MTLSTLRHDLHGGGYATFAVLLLLLLISAFRRFFLPKWRRFFFSSVSPVIRNSGNVLITDDYSNAPTIVTEADLQKLILLFEENFSSDNKHSSWISVVDKQNERVSYHAKQREPEDGLPTEYLSSSVFRNCSPEQLRDFYMDNDYRMAWDKTFHRFEQLDINEMTGQEIGHFVKRFPFVRPREYVAAWRMWEGPDGSYYYYAKNCEHPRAPKNDSCTRVEHYLSGWHISKVPGTDACEVKMWHQEDTTPSAKMAFSYRIWSYVCLMEKSLRNHKKSWCNGERNAVTLAQKLPLAAVIQSTSIFPSMVNQQKTDSKKGTLKQTGKWMANGILVLGTAALCARRSAPIVAKLAAIYAVKRLVKPSTSIRQVPQQYRSFGANVY